MANDRIYQLPVETITLPEDQKARVHQVAAETVTLPDYQKARLHQVAVEVIYPMADLATSRARAFIIG